MEIKQPLIIDISHWESVDWQNLDARVVGVFMKATQGKFYIDPTFSYNFNGAGSIKKPRSPYHFFEPNDIGIQVANYLTTCEEVGAIVGGIWKAEIEPLLDAEYQPPTTVQKVSRSVGLDVKVKPKYMREKAWLDQQYPDDYLLKRNFGSPVRLRSNPAFAWTPGAVGAEVSVTGAVLSAQYQAWLTLVEAEVKVRPIIYTSKWCWQHTGWPTWAKDYKLFDAQYPYNPDGQTNPLYMPYGGWEDWWLWQYSAAGKLAGITGAVDLDVFNGSIQDWDYFYGGGYGQNPNPEPPTGGTMGYKVNVRADATGEPNIRATGGAVLGLDIGNFHKGQTGLGTELLEGPGYRCLKVTSGADVIGWIYDLWKYNPTYAQIEVVNEPPSTNPVKVHDIEVYSDGMISIDGGARQ